MGYTRPEPGQPILIEAGGKTLELRYTLKVLKELDSEHHINVLKGQMVETLQDPARMVTLLFAGLKTKQPELTEEWVENNFDSNMLIGLAPMLAFATTGRWVDIEKALDAVATPPLPNADRPKEALGSTSGPSVASTSAVPN